MGRKTSSNPANRQPANNSTQAATNQRPGSNSTATRNNASKVGGLTGSVTSQTGGNRKDETKSKVKVHF